MLGCGLLRGSQENVKTLAWSDLLHLEEAAVGGQQNVKTQSWRDLGNLAEVPVGSEENVKAPCRPTRTKNVTRSTSPSSSGFCPLPTNAYQKRHAFNQPLQFGGGSCWQ